MPKLARTPGVANPCVRLKQGRCRGGGGAEGVKAPLKVKRGKIENRKIWGIFMHQWY